MALQQRRVSIRNAGLVLVHPFLPHLFSQMELTSSLTGGAAWTDRGSARHAVYLLQWLVDGTAFAPGTESSLCRLLCGLPVDSPAEPPEEITAQEQAIMSDLLKSMIAAWPGMDQASPQNLRENFLQRAGDLLFADNRWSLQIETRAFDLLLDRLPWSFSVVQLPWMPLSLSVLWR